jgi:hypothetical protein
LSRKRQHALEHGDADWQIAIEVKERSEEIRGLDGNEFGNGQRRRRSNAIKPDRNTH